MHEAAGITWGSFDRLREFPTEARREAGYQLDRIQNGLEPKDWKPIPSIGAGVGEIRIHAESGIPRHLSRKTCLCGLRSARVSEKDAADRQAGQRLGHKTLSGIVA